VTNPFFDQKPTVVLETGKPKSEMLAAAVIAGAGGGQVLYMPDKLPDDCSPVFVGMRPQIARLIHERHRLLRPYVTIDNGYFLPYKEGGYFRVTQNGLQTCQVPDQMELEAATRWDSLRVKLDPPKLRNRNGLTTTWGPDPVPEGHILLVLQSRPWYEMVLHQNRDDWVGSALSMLEREYPGVPIRVRDKPLKGGVPIAPLVDDLQDARLVVALSSAVLLAAAVRGIPVLPLGRCAASPLSVRYDDGDRRIETFTNLAANQWTNQEIAAGICWRDMSARPAPFFLDLA